MFYLQSSLDVAYHISMRIYKLFNLASLPKNDFTLVLYYVHFESMKCKY